LGGRAVEVTEVTNTKVEAVEAEKAMKITLTQEVAEIGRPWKYRCHKYQSGGR
jgi:hypothetical protein